MKIIIETRPSDAPAIESVWQSQSLKAGKFLSVAACTWEMVLTRLDGKTDLTIRGPETKASIADCPVDGEWLGIQFKLGTYMPLFSLNNLRDRNDVTLQDNARRSFYLNGSVWEYPTFENAETFVKKLVKHGLIATDPYAAGLFEGQQPISKRSSQRHFLKATGITQAQVKQIERARRATILLQRGVSITQVIGELAYYDQPHLTRSLRHYIGLTPTQIAGGKEPLSLLYNTHET